ncbi:MAG: efflux transporter outer membrane subunit, partial [Polyangia bacterium]
MRAFSATFLVVATCLVIVGCTVGPDYRRPDAPAPPESFKEAPASTLPAVSWRQARPRDGAPRGKWWESYNDVKLNALEDELTVANQNLKAATAQYLQAREQVSVARASYFPTVSAGPSVASTRESYNQANTVRGVTQFQFNTLALQGQVLWEPDLWGQIRRTVEQARANAQASAADLASVELSLRAELATDYFELRGLDAQRRLLDKTVASDADYLQLTQVRLRGGVGTEVDVAQAEAQYQGVQAQAVAIGVARAQYEHAIATLVGVPAPAFSLPAMPLDIVPPAIPSGLPSELLERRPDVAGAERRTAAANAQIGIAIAAYYPNITLGATG